MNTAAISLLLVFGGVLGFTWMVASENTELKMQLKVANENIRKQNEAIEQMALDTAAYACSIDSLNDYAASKYEKVITEHLDDSCETKLKSLEDAMHIFHNFK